MARKFIQKARLKRGALSRQLKIKENRNILIIDDVTTTGTTLKETRRLLKKAGAKNIFCITVAQG